LRGGIEYTYKIENFISFGLVGYILVFILLLLTDSLWLIDIEYGWSKGFNTTSDCYSGILEGENGMRKFIKDLLIFG